MQVHYFRIGQAMGSEVTEAVAPTFGTVEVVFVQYCNFL